MVDLGRVQKDGAVRSSRIAAKAAEQAAIPPPRGPTPLAPKKSRTTKASKGKTSTKKVASTKPANKANKKTQATSKTAAKSSDNATKKAPVQAKKKRPYVRRPDTLAPQSAGLNGVAPPGWSGKRCYPWQLKDYRARIAPARSPEPPVLKAASAGVSKSRSKSCGSHAGSGSPPKPRFRAGTRSPSQPCSRAGTRSPSKPRSQAASKARSRSPSRGPSRSPAKSPAKSPARASS